MEIHATLTKEWKRRWLILTGFIFAGALWFYYDGFIGYPKMAERYEKYEQLTEELISSGKAVDKRDQIVIESWREYATEQGWERDIPKNKDEKDFSNQKKYGSVLVVASLVLLGWYYKSTRLSVHFDGTTITGTDGNQVKAVDVTSIDKRKWENKGIVYAHYSKDDHAQKMTLDAYKFDGVEKIVDLLDKRLNPEEIAQTKNKAS
ncbi:MAG: hypothetical protein AAF649_01630 [Verrucomicrobiota bacterium]